MSHTLIIYADKHYKESQIRLKRQAKNLGIFNRIITYSPKDLPPYIISSPLMAFKKGGGYWIWKPWIIKDALSKCKTGDVVWYIDAGCSLNKKSKELDLILDKIENHNLVCFHYKQNVKYDGWEKYGNINTIDSIDKVDIRHWTKPSTINYFISEYDKLVEIVPKIWGGAIIIKKGIAEEFIDLWLRISLLKPELVIDPFGDEVNDLPTSFYAHRHDQSIITPLLWTMKESHNFNILPELSESEQSEAFIQATRWSLRGTNTLNKIKSMIHIYLNGNR